MKTQIRQGWDIRNRAFVLNNSLNRPKKALFARSRAQRAYYARAAFVRRHRRQELVSRLALSTQPGGPNQPGGGGGGGSVSVPSNNQVVLTASAYEAILGDRISIMYDGQVRLFAAAPRQVAVGTINPNIKLVSRAEEGLV